MPEREQKTKSNQVYINFNTATDSSCFNFVSEFFVNLFIAHEQSLLFVVIIMSQGFSVFLFSLVFGKSIPFLQFFHTLNVRVNIEFLRCPFLVWLPPVLSFWVTFDAGASSMEERGSFGSCLIPVAVWAPETLEWLFEVDERGFNRTEFDSYPFGVPDLSRLIFFFSKIAKGHGVGER